MPETSSFFIARRLCAFSLTCAFVSLGLQFESLVGSCGIYPSEIPTGILSLLCFVCAFIGFLSFINVGAKRPEIISYLGLVFLGMQCVSSSAISDGILLTTADRLLIELCVLLHPKIHSHIGVKFFIFRYMFAALNGQLLTCGGNWDDWQGFKYDVVNQPFPLGPVWHINRMPPLIVSALSVLTIFAEVGVGIGVLLSPVFSPAEMCAIFWGLIYTACMLLLGNFNWSLTVFGAALVASLPSYTVDWIFGLQMLTRWGFSPKTTAKTRVEMETTATWVILFSTISTLFAIAFYVLVPLRGVLLSELGLNESFLRRIFGGLAFASLLALIPHFISQHPTRKLNPPRVLAVVGFMMCSADVLMLTVINRGELPATWSPDYSSSLACSTFSGESDLHSRTGRTGYIFQVKLRKGEQRYLNFVLPENTLLEESRPSHLLFDLPRLSLALWRAAVAGYHSTPGVRHLLQTLRDRLNTGHSSLPMIFSDSNPASIAKLMADGSNEVTTYHQDYVLSTRFADHLWFLRTDSIVVVDKAKSSEALSECTRSVINVDWIRKVGSIHIAAVTVTFASLIAKLVFL